MELKATRYRLEQHTAFIELCRPERMNAWTGRMHTEYRHLLQRAQEEGARVVVLTGAGRGFCIGGDSMALEGHSERGEYDSGTEQDMAQPGYGVNKAFDEDFAYHFGLQTPIIAAINGPAAGVGLALACYADIRFVAPGIKFTTAHGKLNLPAEFGLSWLLPRMIGLAHANDLLLSSRVFTSEEGVEMGLFNALVSAEQLLDHATAYARNLVESVSPESLRASKRQIALDLHREVGDSVHDANHRLREMVKQDDYREGVAAFLEKRPPKWNA